MATNITGLPAAQFATPQTSIRLKQAVQKLFGSTLIQLFSQNDNTIKSELDRSFQMLETANVRIKPFASEALNGTDIAGNIIYEANSYGNITVGLDNIANKGWSYRDINQAVLDDNAEADYLEVNTSAIIRKIERTIIDRMRTSPLIPVGQVFGTNGVALNANVFRKVRTGATKFGIDPNETIFIVLDADFYEQIGAIPEFANILGNAVGNVQLQANEVNGQQCKVGGFFNMVFICSNYYTRAVPASDPVGTAFVKSSMVLPVRKLPVTIPAFQTLAEYQGVSMLYTKNFDASKVGGVVINAKLECLYGLREISGDINATGVLQTAPLWNIRGGI
jgi:hypothetical protein